MVDFSILRGGIDARLLAAGDNQEQRAKIARAIAEAHSAVDRSDVRGIEYMNAKGDAYRKVLFVLELSKQYAERGGEEFVRDEAPEHLGNKDDGDPLYEREVERLWAIVERVLAEELD